MFEFCTEQLEELCFLQATERIAKWLSVVRSKAYQTSLAYHMIFYSSL